MLPPGKSQRTVPRHLNPAGRFPPGSCSSNSVVQGVQRQTSLHAHAYAFTHTHLRSQTVHFLNIRRSLGSLGQQRRWRWRRSEAFDSSPSLRECVRRETWLPCGAEGARGSRTGLPFMHHEVHCDGRSESRFDGCRGSCGCVPGVPGVPGTPKGGRLFQRFAVSQPGV